MKRMDKLPKNLSRSLSFFTALLTVSLATQALAVLAPDPSTLGQDGNIRRQSLPPWGINGKALDVVHTLDGKRVFVLTETHQVQIYTADGTKLGAIPVDAGVKNMDISPVGDKLYLVDNNKGTFSTRAIAFRQEIDTQGVPTKGADEAPISIILFTDFQCPYCKKLPPVLDTVLEKNKGKVKLYFKNLPLISIHPFAKGAALAAIAAQNQGKFWEYHDKLFGAKQLEPNMFEKFAEELSFDMEKFKHDMTAPETKRRLQQDLITAQQAGVDGTPSIYINGWPLGSRTVEGFQTLIDDELGKLGKLNKADNKETPKEKKNEDKQ